MDVKGNNITIEIGASAKTASDNIKQLSSALKELKSSVSGSTKGISPLAKRLSELAQAVNGVSDSGKKLSSMAKVFESIGKIGESKIPKSLSENLKNIVDSVKDVSPQAINNLDKMTSALQRLSGVDLKGFKDVAEQSSAASVQARVEEATSNKKISVVGDAAKYERELNRIDKSIERTIKKIALFRKNLMAEQSTEGGGDAEKVKNYNAAIEEQVELLDKLIEQRKRLAETEDSTPGGLKGIFSQIMSQKSLWTDIGEFGKKSASGISDAFHRMADNIKLSVSNAFGAFSGAVGGKAISALRGTLFTVLQPLALVAKGAVNLGKKLGGTLLKGASVAGRGILSFGKTLITLPFKKTIESVGGFVKKIGQLGAAFKRVMFYRAIRTIIKQIGDALKEGVQNLYYYSQGIGGQFAASMDMAATSMLYFKNSIGAAVAPLVNAFAPVLDMIVDKVVEVINVINQLFAKLTGASSWTKAIKYPKQYDDAVSGAGKSAKEALRYLAPFDELNVLPSDNAGRGSGASAAEDYSSMFEEVVQFNDAISDFAEKIREAINAGNWSDVGKLLGEKVNGIVNSIDFAGIGAKIGEKINDWFTTKYWTFKTINFKNIGSKVAEFLTGDDGIGGALRSIDFETVGRSFAQKFTILPDMIIGFIQQADWKKIGQSIGDYLRGVFDEASEWLQGYDWSDIGSDLWQKLKDLVGGIDFASLAESFFRLLGSAFKAAVGLIGGVVGEIWSDITGYFDNYITNDDGTRKTGWKFFQGILNGIWDAVKGIGKWVDEHIVSPFFDAILGEGTWEKFKTKFKTKWNDFIDSIASGWLGGGLMDLLGIDPEKLKFDIKANADFKTSTDNLTMKDRTISTKANLNMVGDNLTMNQRTVSTKANLKMVGDNLTMNQRTVPAKASLKMVGDNLTMNQRTVPAKANLKMVGDNLTMNQRTVSATANFNKADYNLTDTQRRFWSIANFVSAYDGLKPDQRTFSSKALFDEYDDRVIRNREIRMKAALDWDGNSGGIILNPRWNATGGVFSNGKWNPITAYAGGGNPMSGELFVAREMGPELVGRMGQHTAVMNNDQIVASVSNGVEVGVTNANENVVNAIFTGVAQIISAMNDNSGSGNFDGLARAVTRWQTNNARANGI